MDMPSHQIETGVAPVAVLSSVDRLAGLAGKLAPRDKMRELYRRVQESSQGLCLETLLNEMQIDMRIDAVDRARVPVMGSTVVVANHPYGVLDGAILTVLLSSVRPDIKILTNSLLGEIPRLQRHCIFVDAFRSDHSIEVERKAHLEALAWLQQGHLLAIFPAGEVSHWQMPAAQLVDPAWNDAAIRLIRRTRSTALPLYFSGHNSVAFQLLSMVHPKLRSAFLLQEFLQQEGRTVEVRVGGAVPAADLDSMTDDRDATEYLRWRTYLLARRGKGDFSWPIALRSRVAAKTQQTVATAIDPALLTREIESLPANRCLATTGEFAVYHASAHEIPNLLLEIGRARETAFRAAGEGTGRSRDLDRFDQHYSHLLLWHKTTQQLVGGYRVGNTAEILAERGLAGLYTSTLFRYDAKLFQKLGPALELGRSFVRPEYQRRYAPLLLLWKGIARLVASRPEVPVLFGAVSISNDYNEASREMIYHFFAARKHEEDLAGLIKPRRPFRPGLLRRWEWRSILPLVRDLEQLSQPITDIESDGKGLPILLRQYARIGGKVLGFNVDRRFSNVVDGLVVVDLRQTEAAVLERYMGREEAAAFRQAHKACGK
jgi:putative hemolysin